MKKILLFIIVLNLGCIKQVNHNFFKHKTVYMTVLKNNTSKSKINEDLTQEFNTLLISSNLFKPVKIENAELIIKGQILSYLKNPQIYDDKDIIQLYSLETDLIIKVYKKTKFLFSFNLKNSISYSENSFNNESENDAFERLKKIISLNFIKELKNQLNKYYKKNETP